MNNALFLISAIITTITFTPVYASQVVTRSQAYAQKLTKPLNKKDKQKKKSYAQLSKEIVQLKKTLKRVDEHYQEEVKSVQEALVQAQEDREQIEQERDEYETKLLHAEQKKQAHAHKLAITVLANNAKIAQLEYEKEALVKSAHAQHELLQFQDEKLKNKRAQITQLQTTLHRTQEELRKRELPTRSPSMIAAMYA